MITAHFKKVMLFVVCLGQSVSAAKGQSDSLTAQRTLQKMDSSIRVNYSQDQYKLIDSLLAIALVQSQTKAGTNGPSYANFLYLKGLTLIQRGSYQEAITQFEQANTIYTKFPLDSNRVVNLARVAQVYSNIGPLSKAQDAIREAEEAICLPTSWRKEFSQLLIWDAKSKVYMKLYDFNQAALYQQNVVDGYRALGGINFDRFYPDAVANLISLLVILQRDHEAVQQINNLKSFLQSQRKPNDTVLFKLYVAEGQISLRQKDYDQAENSFLQALLVVSQKNFTNKIAKSSIYILLAGFYQNNRNDADRAEYYLTLSRSVEIVNDYLTPRTLNDLAALHMQKGLFQQAATELAESQRLIRVEQESNFNFTAVRQKEIESLSNQAPFLNALSFAAFLKQKGEKQDTLFRGLSYDATLYSNGLLLDDARRIRFAIINSRDTATQQLYKKWTLLKQHAADSLATYPARTNQVKQEIEQLEQQMARKSAEYRAGKARSQIGWRQIREKLNPDEAAIAFVRFPAFNAAEKSADSTLYAALVLRHNQSAPEMIILCSENQLIRALTRQRQIAPILASRGTELGSRHRFVETSELYRLIWQPMISALRNVKRVYYSPSGLLHNISLAGLRVPVTKNGVQTYLTDHYELRQLFSTRDVADGIRPLRGASALTVMLIGGVNYGSSASNLFDALPGSAREVQQISRLMPRATILKDTVASEKRIKALSNKSPAILHVATHGFYRAKYAPTEPVSQTLNVSTQSTADPLHRSGLAMAGANYARLTNEWELGANDGILTAYEVSLLNLSQTRLVVLSACETALGDVQGTEGVYGLQRAFRLAGAEKLIVSLSSVPDRATQQLMTLFYSYFRKGIEVNNAFRQAQYRLRQVYPDPSIWGAFVLIE